MTETIHHPESLLQRILRLWVKHAEYSAMCGFIDI